MRQAAVKCEPYCAMIGQPGSFFLGGVCSLGNIVVLDRLLSNVSWVGQPLVLGGGCLWVIEWLREEGVTGPAYSGQAAVKCELGQPLWGWGSVGRALVGGRGWGRPCLL